MSIRSKFLLAALLSFMSFSLYAENHILAEVKFLPATKVEQNAGVWVDGQYLGYVKELKGSKKILLMPGQHEIMIREPWYNDYVKHPLLEPGQVHTIQLTMTRNANSQKINATAELKISADPARAAVFVDDQYVGHVDEFNGPGQALLLVPGEHHVRLALAGYQPFETTVDVRDHQKLKIETKLLKGSIEQAGRRIKEQ